MSSGGGCGDSTAEGVLLKTGALSQRVSGLLRTRWQPRCCSLYSFHNPHVKVMRVYDSERDFISGAKCQHLFYLYHDTLSEASASRRRANVSALAAMFEKQLRVSPANLLSRSVPEDETGGGKLSPARRSPSIHVGGARDYDELSFRFPRKPSVKVSPDAGGGSAEEGYASLGTAMSPHAH